MPSEPPTRDQWTPDAKATVCMVCKVERFSMVRFKYLLYSNEGLLVKRPDQFLKASHNIV